MRDYTRQDNIERHKNKAQTLPFSLCCVNFMFDGNLGFAIRSAACFGVSEVLVIGAPPSHKLLLRESAGTYPHLNIRYFKTTAEVLAYTRNMKRVSLELTPEATALEDYEFVFYKQTCFFVGHETLGVPADILFASDVVMIDHQGFGPCLNTSQAATVAMYEYSKQWSRQ